MIEIVKQQESGVVQQEDDDTIVASDSPKAFADKFVEQKHIRMEHLNEWDLILGQKANGLSNSLSKATKLYRNMRVAFLNDISPSDRRNAISTFIDEFHEAVATEMGVVTSCFWMAIRVSGENKVNTVNHNDGNAASPRYYRNRIASFKSRNGKTIYCRAVTDCHQALLDDMKNLRPNKQKNCPNNHKKRPQSPTSITPLVIASSADDGHHNLDSNRSNNHFVTEMTVTATRVPSASSTTTMEPPTKKVKLDHQTLLHPTTSNYLVGNTMFEETRTTSGDRIFMSAELRAAPSITNNDVFRTRMPSLQCNNSHSLSMFEQFELRKKIKSHQQQHQQQLLETPPSTTTAETTANDIAMAKNSSTNDPFTCSLEQYVASRIVNSNYINNNSLTGGASSAKTTREPKKRRRRRCRRCCRCCKRCCRRRQERQLQKQLQGQVLL